MDQPSSPYNNKNFKKLKIEWYKKLKNSGFDDIEQDEEHLKSWSSKFSTSKFVRENPTFVETKAEYYRLASQFLHSYAFESATEKYIWAMHSEGMSIRNIIKVLKGQGVTAYKDLVHGTVRRLAKIMVQDA